jgi:hypothetical protein
VETQTQENLPSTSTKVVRKPLKQNRKIDSKYRVMKKEFRMKFINDLNNPESHAQYQDEWKKFWVEKYKEIVASGLDPNNYNYNRDWIVFWPKRILQIHKENLQIKKREIKMEFKTNVKEKNDSEDSEDDELIFRRIFPNIDPNI